MTAERERGHKEQCVILLMDADKEAAHIPAAAFYEQALHGVLSSSE